MLTVTCTAREVPATEQACELEHDVNMAPADYCRLKLADGADGTDCRVEHSAGLLSWLGQKGLLMLMPAATHALLLL